MTGIGRWYAAVRRTAGLVLLSEGRPADTVYFSTSNGQTYGNEDVFGSAPFFVIRSQGAHPVTDATPYNHYTLLATLEKAWGLGCLNEACKVGPTGLMTTLFQ